MYQRELYLSFVLLNIFDEILTLIFYFVLFFTEEKKREKRRNKKKVKFSENVMVKEFREKKGKKNRVSISECRNEIPETKAMPANRVALYNGILRDRVQRMGCCH